jgi:hypothetical protein
MAFSFEKFVHKHTRTLFSFIVVTMVLPLILWGYMGKSGNEKEEEKGDAGVIFDTIHVSKSEYNVHLARATASFWWKSYNDRMKMMMAQYYGQQPKPPTPEDLYKQAWEDIILLREAKAQGIQASEQETLMQERDIYQRFTKSFDYRTDIMGKIATDLFHVSLPTLEAWIADFVVIDKLLNLITSSEFSDYDKVYERLLSGHGMAKVWYAAFDPKDYLREVKTPTTDEIATYYQKNKDKFKVAAKVQVAYLMSDFDELKKGVAEPSEAEVKKYYEDNKLAEFTKPHAEHTPDSPHHEDEKPEVKTFDEVKGEIPNKIKQKAAERLAAEIMNKVDVALGAAATANNNKYPDDVFDQLKAKFKAEKIELSYDITSAFDSKQIEDIEKTVGTNSTLATWAFDPAQKIGDVSQKVKTSKGIALFRLQKRIDAIDPGISERIRESIVKELQKEQIKKKTQQMASNVVQEITTHGMISARLKYPLDWRLTRYFKVGGPDTGIEDQALGQAINQQIQGNQVTPGKAAVLSGQMLRSPEKADWAYVVYLEDLMEGAPEDVATKFSGERRQLDEESRHRYRDIYIQERVSQAHLIPDPSLKKPENPSDSTPKS